MVDFMENKNLATDTQNADADKEGAAVLES